MCHSNPRRAARETREWLAAMKEQKRFDALSPEEQQAEIEAEEAERIRKEENRKAEVAKKFGLDVYDAEKIRELSRKLLEEKDLERKRKHEEHLEIIRFYKKNANTITLEQLFEHEDDDRHRSHRAISFLSIRGFSGVRMGDILSKISDLYRLTKGAYSWEEMITPEQAVVELKMYIQKVLKSKSNRYK